MRDSDANHLKSIISQIATASPGLDRSDFVSLLILLREPAPRGSVIEDLGHCVAHDERDRGYAFGYLQRFAQKLRKWLTYGGRLETPIAFPIEDVIAEINSVARSLSIDVALDAGLPSVRRCLADGIAFALDGTSFKLNGARGAFGVNQDHEGINHYYVRISQRDAIDGVLQVPAGLPMAFPWLMDTDSGEPKPAPERD